MKQFYLLDLIRGIAALLVVMGHLRSLMFESWNGGNLFKFIFYAITSLGHQAVIVFFVLSGFFVGGSFLADTSKDIIKYSIKRTSRFYTVLFPALCMTWIVDFIGINFSGATELYSGNSPNYVLNYNVAERLGIDTFISNLFYFQDIFYPTYGSNDALWSLAYEFWFYIIFPAGYFLLYHSNKIYKIVSFLIVSLMLFFLGLKGLVFLFVWLIGVLVFILNSSVFEKAILNKYIYLMMPLILMILYLSYICNNLLSDFLLGIAFGLVLLILINIKDFKNKFLKETSFFIAKISFSMYAIHLPFIILVVAFVTKGEILEFNFINLIFYILIISLVLLVSFVFWIFFESRTYLVGSYLNNFIKKWKGSK